MQQPIQQPPVFVPFPMPPTWLQIATPAATLLAAIIALGAVVVTMRQRRADLVRAEQREIAVPVLMPVSSVSLDGPCGSRSRTTRTAGPRGASS